jgi:WhiB family redox-sensing transcriptional regulator
MEPDSLDLLTGNTREQLELIEDMKRWGPQGACRRPGVNQRLFIMDRTRDKKENKLAEARAKAICQQCPVSDDCLFHALEFPETAGIWGGLTDLERGRLLGKRQKR